jgi:hypothetical protein
VEDDASHNPVLGCIPWENKENKVIGVAAKALK